MPRSAVAISRHCKEASSFTV